MVVKNSPNKVLDWQIFEGAGFCVERAGVTEFVGPIDELRRKKQPEIILVPGGDRSMREKTKISNRQVLDNQSRVDYWKWRF